MFFAPLIQGRGDWGYIQMVWDRWQALNVGMLALVASLIALRTVTMQERERARRELISSRAFLPQALSDLAEYCFESARFLEQAKLYRATQDETGQVTTAPRIPEFPADVYTTFDRCIRAAPHREGGYITSLVHELQVHRSRLRSFRLGGESAGDQVRVHQLTTVAYLAALILIRARIDVLLPWARSDVQTIDSRLTEANMVTALKLLGFVPEMQREAMELSFKLAAKEPVV